MTSTAGIGIAALLDRACEDRRVAKLQTEKQKAKGKAVSCYDLIYLTFTN
jgi:hypothetical protein